MKIGLGEIDIHWEDKSLNKLNCNLIIEKATEKHVDLVLFPEMSLTGFSMNVKNISEANTETFLWFQELAQKYKINIGFGWAKNNNGSMENTYSIVTEDLNNTISYSKIHLFAPGKEDKYFNPGKKIFKININDFSICPFICYDLRFPDIFQSAAKSCSLITVAANWPDKRKDHWFTLLKARAIENQCYVAGINREGTGQQIFYSGGSCIFSPLGEKIPQETFSIDNNSLFISDIYMENVTKVRKDFKMY